MSLKTANLGQLSKGIVTICTIPPEIHPIFDPKLLSYPMPGMKEPQYYRDYYGERIKKKYKPGSNQWKEYELVMEVYEELYEWKKAAEAHGQKEITKATKGPVIPIEALYRLRGGLGHSLRSTLKVGKRRLAA